MLLQLKTLKNQEQIKRERGKFRHQLEGASKRLLERMIGDVLKMLLDKPQLRRDWPLITIIRNHLQPHAATFYDLHTFDKLFPEAH